MGDVVGEEPMPVTEIAARVDADPSSLRRVMRLLASIGIFSEAEPGSFVATPMSDLLRDDRPDSVRYLAMQQGSPTYRAAGELLQSVRTGEPTAEAVLGKPFFDYLADDAEASDLFNRAMAGNARARAAATLAFDWGGVATVADIGGGNGSLLTTLLAAEEHLRGVVFDLPHVVQDARPVIDEAGLSARCETAGGDFFADDLPGADVYLMAQILHDWDDERALAILRNCRRSIADGGRLLVVDMVMPEGQEPSYGKLLDLIMMCMIGGKERTEPEWRALLADGGWELDRVTTGPAISLLEAVPA